MGNLYRFKPEELPLGKTMLLNLVGCFFIALLLWPFVQLDFVVLLLHSVLIGTSAMLLIGFGLPSLDRLGLRSVCGESAIRIAFIVLFAILAYLVGSVTARLSLGMPVQPLFGIDGFRQGSGEETMIVATILGALTMTSIFAIYHRFMSFKLDTIKAREQEELAKRQATDAQLSMLKAQIEPHMVFNTLATIRALIGSDPVIAQNMMDEFIQFLRITLSGSQNPTVNLKTEFSMLENYLSLWKYRLDKRLKFSLNLPLDLENFRVPSMLLQPLVENAVRHGIEPCIDGGEVGVVVKRSGNSVIISVHNTGQEMDVTTLQQIQGDRELLENDSGGLGLGQLRSRLRSFYDGKASYRIISSPDNGTAITITIDANAAKQESAMDDAVLSS